MADAQPKEGRLVVCFIITKKFLNSCLANKFKKVCVFLKNLS